jgi:hypothetical protein
VDGETNFAFTNTDEKQNIKMLCLEWSNESFDVTNMPSYLLSHIPQKVLCDINLQIFNVNMVMVRNTEVITDKFNVAGTCTLWKLRMKID